MTDIQTRATRVECETIDGDWLEFDATIHDGMPIIEITCVGIGPGYMTVEHEEFERMVIALLHLFPRLREAARAYEE